MTALPLTAPSAANTPYSGRLDDTNAHVRRVALLELADLGDPEYVPEFIARLQDDASPDVRAEAARVLGDWERGDVVESLCGALLDSDEAVREAAALSLSELKDARSALVLLAWAERPEPFVRVSVLRGLRELRYADAFGIANGALADDAPAVRIEAIAVLGWLKDRRALATLAALTAADPQPSVRRAAAGALGFASAADPQVVSALLAALRDAAWQVREQAAATLGKLRPSSACEPLMAALNDAYWQVRLRAVRALGELRDAHAAAPIAALLDHSISNLRKEAALALGELGVRETLAALRQALQDPDPDVRKSARIAIAQIEQTRR
ncbi:MAG TPA: HEAT repeat domain-containing protein [Trinickia sp.]|uniref:HEAT repeat domain-containing protein n=1 Tax=Trinickia sp. TaxID=2571163 RepID=UPI002D0F05F6|nr:HEAT repeat domain-containing protein [Trinickia sp.]HVW49939.1 HEAT repeat domain-containing protein [Trinickia sp.]